MWSRVVEAMIGCWLMMSPFIFQHSQDHWGLWVNDLACSSIVIVLALLSYWSPTKHAHLGTIIVGSWLVAFAFLIGFGNPIPASQNHFVIGLLLIMFAVIPNHASRPNENWSSTSM